MAIILLVFILVLSTLFLTFLKYKKKKPFHPPPGPKGLPFIGNLHQYDFSKPHLYLAKLAKTYGPIVSLRVGCAQMVVVQSANLAKEVLKTQDLNFCARPSMVGMQKLSYNGLDISFSQYNEYFREVKKICVVHLFNSKRVRSLTPMLQQEISRMMEKISKLSSDSCMVNLSSLMSDLACKNICKIAFGRSYDEDEDGSNFRRLLDESEEVFVDFAYSDYFPSLGWLDKLTGKSARLEKLFLDLDAFYEKIIDEHLRPHDRDNNREDLIDVLLQLRKERSFTFDFTLNHVKAIVMDIFVAGTDTGSTMIIWAMTELIKHPSAMKQVQDELRNAITKTGHISEDDLNDLVYFKAVVKETFRLHPAAPLLIAHQAIQKTSVDGYDILPNTLVFVNAWAIGRDSASWKDPESFMPERFLGSKIDFKGQDFELIPFGAGRRMCPGLHLGTLLVEVTLANLLYSFDWELPVGVNKEDVDTDTLLGITMRKMNPLCLMPKTFPQH
ncbi:cytochrome P450 83B1-like [Silene latifolia]|uniref:cytochrome P450 83B1-like n=1 Tax=Silene latifolia TaxID=37657 RepID=UPI003D779DA4